MKRSNLSLKELTGLAKQQPLYNPFTGSHLFHFRNSKQNVMHFKSADEKEVWVIYSPVQRKENKKFFEKVRNSLW